MTLFQAFGQFAAAGAVEVLPPGAMTITPSSVDVVGSGSSASIGSNGEVTFSTADQLALNDVFSSNFTNYMVVGRFTPGPTNYSVDWRLRVGGSDNSTSSSYVRQSGSAGGGTPGASTTVVSNLGRVFVNYTTIDTTEWVAHVYAPALAQKTVWASSSLNSSGNATRDIYVGSHNQTVSYDGFNLLFGSTGSPIDTGGEVQVYGLRS